MDDRPRYTSRRARENFTPAAGEVTGIDPHIFFTGRRCNAGGQADDAASFDWHYLLHGGGRAVWARGFGAHVGVSQRGAPPADYAGALVVSGDVDGERVVGG